MGWWDVAAGLEQAGLASAGAAPAGGVLPAVVALVTLATLVSAACRTAQSPSLPELVDDPADLTAVNVLWVCPARSVDRPLAPGGRAVVRG